MSNSKRILVVDDELTLAMVLARGLEIMGEDYEVDTVGSGPEALALLAQQPYHLMITDHQMPDMTGIELLQQTQQSAPEMRVIMMTAHGVNYLRKKLVEVKVDRLFGKPFNLKEFREAVRTLLNETEPQ